MQKRGLSYEKKILKLLKAHYEEIIDHPWIKYDDRYCQPDALIVTPKRIIVVEVKLSYREEAVEKLNLLYGPLSSELYPERDVRLCQITRTLPEGFSEDVYTIEQALSVDKPYFTIHSTGR